MTADSWRLRNGNPVIRDLSTGQTRQITRLPDGTRARRAVLSPDSRRVAYGIKDDAQGSAIGVINIDGSSGSSAVYRMQAENVWPLNWSPDMTRLLVGAWSNKQGAFFWISLVDGRVERISTRAIHEGEGFLSPHGRYIAFAGIPTENKGPGAAHDIYLISADGSAETVARAELADESPIGWIADPVQVLYTKARRNYLSLWSLPVANGKVQGAVRMLQASLGEGSRELGATRSGTLFYRTASVLTPQDVFTAIMDPTTGRVTSSPIRLPLSRTGHNFSPRFSRDGRLLVSWLQDVPENPISVKEFFVYSFETGQEQPIVTKTDIRGAAWCWEKGDASFLTNGPERPPVIRVDARTGDTSPAFNGTLPRSISCSANGDLLVMEDKVMKKIILRDMHTGAERELYKAQENETVLCPEISPDGTQVVFFRSQRNAVALVVVPTSGGTGRELLRVEGSTELQTFKGATWSPDGRYVYYSKRVNRDAPYELFRIAATGGREENLGLKAASILAPDISRDGARIAFASGIQKVGIWAIESVVMSDK